MEKFLGTAAVIGAVLVGLVLFDPALAVRVAAQ
jgi:hypothetical protein